MDTEWLCVGFEEYESIKIYKSPTMRLQTSDLPMFLHFSLYADDYNSPHINFVYNNNSANGDC